jgi:plasmid stabilization system protein ParE
MIGFVFHPDAYTDLADIWEYIAADSIDAADRFREEIYDKIKRLVPFPNQGHRREDLTSREILFHPCGEYLIAYAPAEKPLLVLAVLQGSRSPRVMATVLRERGVDAGPRRL